MHRHCVATGVGLAALLLCLCSQGQDYADFVLKKGFGSQTASGETGGEVDAQQAYGNGCLGLIDESPDHQLEVQEELTLSLTLDSTTDSTLVVQGTGGLFCDDDSAGGHDAHITARLVPGHYDLYVGDIQQSGYYRLTISEGNRPPPGPGKRAVQQYADFKFGSNAQEAVQVSGGMTGGAPDSAVDAARTYGGECDGIIDRTPDHHLFISTRAMLKFALESSTDATLVVSGPDALLLCEPNRSGSGETALQASLLPGRYEVYVGHRDAVGVYRLTVTELTDD